MGATATLRGVLTLNDNLFRAGLRKAMAAAKGFATGMGGVLKAVVSGPLGKIGGLIAAAGTALAGMAGVDALTDFYTQIQQVAAVSGATAKEMELLKMRAREMGKESSFSAAEAAEGMATLAQAGFTVNEVMSATGPLLDLATAGGIGLAEAMTTATGIMGPFNLKAQDAGRIADVLAKAASSTNAGVNDMGQAMNAVAPVAGQLGLRFEEVAAALGLLSSGNIKGSAAGTALRAVLSRLVAPTGEVEEGLAKLGVQARDVNPATHSLSQILKTLGDASDKTGSKSATAAASVGIFGLEAASAGGILLKMRGDLGKVTDSLDHAQGEAKRMGQIMGDQLGGDFKKFQAQAKEAAIALGEAGLTKVLRSATQLATRFMGSISGSGASKLKDAFSAINGAFKDPDTLLSGLGAGMKSIGAEFGNVIVEAGVRLVKMLWEATKAVGDGLAGAAMEAAGAITFNDDLKEAGVQQQDDAKGNFWEAMDKIRAAPIPDLFGAKDFYKQAKDAFDKLKEAGKDAVEDSVSTAATDMASGAKKVMLQSTSTLSATSTGGLKGASMALGANGFADLFSAGANRSMGNTSLNRGAYGSTSLLSLRERREFENGQVASGKAREGSSPGAFGAVRRGDHSRRREYLKEQARGQQGVEKTNTLLEQQLAVTKEAWQ